MTFVFFNHRTETKGRLKVTWERHTKGEGRRAVHPLCLLADHMLVHRVKAGHEKHTASLREKVTVQYHSNGLWLLLDFSLYAPVVKATSALHFGHLGCLSVLVFSDHLSLPLPQALHLTCLQLGQILLLHVHTAKLGAKGIV